jgi:hypothetical protein
MRSNLKRRIGVFAALAVLAAGVPALTTTPASAAAATTLILAVGDPATYSACPTGSAAAAGFTDTTSTDVDCIKMYGITTGVTATTYEPTASVPRWQMALYLTRMAGPTQVTLGTGADQGFTDISGKSADIQTAINQIKQLGVTVGKTATTFAPDDNVTREEMALFIQRMLHVTPTGPGGQSDSLTSVNVDGDTATYNFTDIDTAVTVEGKDAIVEMWNLGVHDGLLATTYSPNSDMTRAAMATFLTAALDHTNARPAGLVMQTDLATKAAASWTAETSISHRSAAFAVIVGTPVDVMVWSPTGGEGDAAFLATGLCDNALTAGSITKCYIDTGELVTNDKGNVSPTLVTSAPAGVVTTSEVYYAWSAAAGTTYDNDLHGEGVRADDDLHSSVTVTATAAAGETRCQLIAPAHTAVSTAAHTAKYGSSITINCQVKDGVGAAAGNVAAANVKVTMTVSRVFTTDAVGTQDGDVVLATSTVGLTDATGALSFTVAGPADPSTTVSDNHIDTIVLTCATACNGGLNLVDTSGRMTETGSDLILTHTQSYLDTAAGAAKTVLTSSATTGLVSAVAGITRLVTATVYDQYGDTVAGNVVTFTATQDLVSGLVCPAVATTICTTLAAHGLSDGDTLKVVEDTNYGAAASTAVMATDGGGGALAVDDYLCVGTVSTTVTLNLEGNDINSTTSYGCGSVLATDSDVPSTAVAPLFVVQTNPDGFTSAVTRTTSSAGSASYSWSDKHSTSGKFVTTATGASASAATHTFYRLDTAADFTEVGANNDAVMDAGDEHSKLVEWDATNDDFTILKAVGTAATHTLVTYMQYSYDANDQFVTGATVTEGSGTATTLALWETAMTTNAATAGGTYGDVALIDYEALSTGISQFSDG